MSQSPSPLNQGAASAASSPSSPQHLPNDLPLGVRAVSAEAEVQESPERLVAEQQPSEEVADHDDDEGNSEYIYVDLEDIRQHFECPICMGIIKNTQTIMECLHRFCKTCIEKAMRVGNNECPVCRIHCPSRRSFREDPNFDKMISLVFPDIDKYEEEVTPLSDEVKSHNAQIKAAMDEIARRQSEAMPKRKRRKTEADDAEPSHASEYVENSSPNQSRSNNVKSVFPPTVENEDIFRDAHEEALQTSEGRKTLTEFGPNCNSNGGPSS